MANGVDQNQEGQAPAPAKQPGVASLSYNDVVAMAKEQNEEIVRDFRKKSEILKDAIKNLGVETKKKALDIVSSLSGGLIEGPTKKIQKQQNEVVRNFELVRKSLKESGSLSEDMVSLLGKYNEEYFKSLGYGEEQTRILMEQKELMSDSARSAEERQAAADKFLDTLKASNQVAKQGQSIWGKINDQIASVSRELIGVELNLKTLLSQATIWKNIADYARDTTEYFRMMHQYRGLAGDMPGFRNLEEIDETVQRAAANLRVADDKIREAMEIAARYGMDLQQALMDVEDSTQNASSSFLAMAVNLERIYGVAAEDAVSVIGELRIALGGTKEAQTQATQIAKQMTDSLVSLGKTAGITGRDISNAYKALGKIMPQLKLRSGTALDPATIQKASEAVVKLTARMREFGASTEQIAQTLENMLDIDRLEENAYAFHLLGVSIQDALNDPAKAMNDLADNMVDKVLEIQDSTSLHLKQMQLKALSNILPPDIIMKINMGQKLTREELEKALQAQKSLQENQEKVKGAFQEISVQFTESFGGLIAELGPLISALIRQFTPWIDSVKNILKFFNSVLKNVNDVFNDKRFSWIPKLVSTAVLLGPIAGNIVKAVGGFFNIIKGVGKKGAIPVYVKNDGMGGGLDEKGGSLLSGLANAGMALGLAALTRVLTKSKDGEVVSARSEEDSGEYEYAAQREAVQKMRRDMAKTYGKEARKQAEYVQAEEDSGEHGHAARKKTVKKTRRDMAETYGKEAKKQAEYVQAGKESEKKKKGKEQTEIKIKTEPIAGKKSGDEESRRPTFLSSFFGRDRVEAMAKSRTDELGAAGALAGKMMRGEMSNPDGSETPYESKSLRYFEIMVDKLTQLVEISSKVGPKAPLFIKSGESFSDKIRSVYGNRIGLDSDIDVSRLTESET